MGRRSDFDRIPRDLYRTFDQAAVKPLLPHLMPGTHFIEPCAGAGDLRDQLEAAGHFCVDAYDIEPLADGIKRRDALTHVPEQSGYVFLTNPPWHRPILHKLIVHLSDLAPTWILVDANWLNGVQKTVAKKHGVQTVPELLKRCRKIVVIGRVKWIPDTKQAGKDDCVWLLLGQPDPHGRPVFYGKEE